MASKTITESRGKRRKPATAPSARRLNPSEIEDLRKIVQDNRAAYERMRDSRNGARCWDYVVITAANRRQAAGYEMQIGQRRASGWIPAAMRTLVIPDPEGQRAGSGGATFNVIRVIARDLANQFQTAGVRPADLGALFAKTRILVIHSGGGSKRIPHYSSYGKIFGTIPVQLPNGRTSTVFDELLVSLATVPERMDEGILVASGDVLLAFDPAAVNFRWPGVTGIAIRSSADLGRRHGVYVPSPDRTHVHHFLQKPSLATMRAAGAVDPSGCVAVDSGLIRFDKAALTALAEIAGRDIKKGEVRELPSVLDRAFGAGEEIDLYDHVLRPLAPATARESYLSDGESLAAREMRACLWDALRPLSLRVCLLDPAMMLHIGTTREFRRLATARSDVAAVYEFQRTLNSYLGVKSPPASAFVVDSVIAADGASIGPRAVIESCALHGTVKIGAGALVHGLKELTPTCVGRDVVAHEVPVALPRDFSRERLRGVKGRVLRLYGVKDDPKVSAEDGGTLFGEPIYTWLDNRNIPSDEVWPAVSPADRSLWNARLYPLIEPGGDSDQRGDPAGGKSDSGRKAITKWTDFLLKTCSASEQEVKEWLRSTRLSLAETFEYADCGRICEERLSVLQSAIQSELAVRLHHEGNCEPIWSRADRLDLLTAVVGFLRNWAKGQENPLLRMRAYKTISDILASSHCRALIPGSQNPSSATGTSFLTMLPPSNEEMAWTVFRSWPSDRRIYEALAEFYLEQTFEEVREAVRAGMARTVSRFERGKAHAVVPLPSATTKSRSVRVALPARIDFGGGWSDTPPHSLCNGGVASNCAVRIDGRQPIQATVRAIDDSVVRLISRDAEVIREFTDPAALWDHRNPSDPLALLKAATCCVGLVPRDAPIAGGFEVETSTRLPQGSGLGTSSILAAAVAKALFEFVGRATTQEELFSCVSYIEQMMGTGGGWQDQIGGVVPGLKLITTMPGCEQTPLIERIRLSPRVRRELENRMILHYVGQRRLASNILHAIMGKYISGDPPTVAILAEIQRIAHGMRRALDIGDVDRFGALMWDHWELNKQLDPETTNARIEAVIDIVRPMISGLKMVGAGGGGYMEIVANDAARCRAIAAALGVIAQDTTAAVYRFEIDDGGPTVRIGDG